MELNENVLNIYMKVTIIVKGLKILKGYDK